MGVHVSVRVCVGGIDVCECGDAIGCGFWCGYGCVAVSLVMGVGVGMGVAVSLGMGVGA